MAKSDGPLDRWDEHRSVKAWRTNGYCEFISKEDDFTGESRTGKSESRLLIDNAFRSATLLPTAESLADWNFHYQPQVQVPVKSQKRSVMPFLIHHHSEMMTMAELHLPGVLFQGDSGAIRMIPGAMLRLINLPQRIAELDSLRIARWNQMESELSGIGSGIWSEVAKRGAPKKSADPKFVIRIAKSAWSDLSGFALKRLPSISLDQLDVIHRLYERVASKVSLKPGIWF